MHYERARRFRRSKVGEAPPPLRYAMLGCAPLRRRMRFFTTPNICRPSFFRAPVDRRLGFRSHRNGGTAPDFALSSACPGTTAQHRHQRSRGTAAALSLWRFRPVSWPSRKDLRKRTGAFAPTTRILSPTVEFANERSESYLSPFSELSRKMRSPTIRMPSSQATLRSPGPLRTVVVFLH